MAVPIVVKNCNLEGRNNLFDRGALYRTKFSSVERFLHYVETVVKPNTSSPTDQPRWIEVEASVPGNTLGRRWSGDSSGQYFLDGEKGAQSRKMISDWAKRNNIK